MDVDSCSLSEEMKGELDELCWEGCTVLADVMPHITPILHGSFGNFTCPWETNPSLKYCAFRIFQNPAMEVLAVKLTCTVVNPIVALLSQCPDATKQDARVYVMGKLGPAVDELVGRLMAEAISGEDTFTAPQYELVTQVGDAVHAMRLLDSAWVVTDAMGLAPFQSLFAGRESPDCAERVAAAVVALLEPNADESTTPQDLAKLWAKLTALDRYHVPAAQLSRIQSFVTADNVFGAEPCAAAVTLSRFLCRLYSFNVRRLSPLEATRRIPSAAESGAAAQAMLARARSSLMSDKSLTEATGKDESKLVSLRKNPVARRVLEAVLVLLGLPTDSVTSPEFLAAIVKFDPSTLTPGALSELEALLRLPAVLPGAHATAHALGKWLRAVYACGLLHIGRGDATPATAERKRDRDAWDLASQLHAALLILQHFLSLFGTVVPLHTDLLSRIPRLVDIAPQSSLCVFALLQRVQEFRGNYGPNSEIGKQQLEMQSEVSRTTFHFIASPSKPFSDTPKGREAISALGSLCFQFMQYIELCGGAQQPMAELTDNYPFAAEGFYAELHANRALQLPQDNIRFLEWFLAAQLFEKELVAKLLAGKSTKPASAINAMFQRLVPDATASKMFLEAVAQKLPSVVKAALTGADNEAKLSFRIFLKAAVTLSKLRDPLFKPTARHVVDAEMAKAQHTVSQLFPAVYTQSARISALLQLAYFLSGVREAWTKEMFSIPLLASAIRELVKKLVTGIAELPHRPREGGVQQSSWAIEAMAGYEELRAAATLRTLSGHEFLLLSRAFDRFAEGLEFMYSSNSTYCGTFLPPSLTKRSGSAIRMYELSGVLLLVIILSSLKSTIKKQQDTAKAKALLINSAQSQFRRVLENEKLKKNVNGNFGKFLSIAENHIGTII